MSNSEKQIERFLKRFHDYNNINDVFTKGCCYWFAVILNKRFPDSEIVYDPIACHFAVKIDGSYYDITGNIDHKYSFRPWNSDMFDPLDKRRTIRDCINF